MFNLLRRKSRPAKVGDTLITTEFWNTATRGFSSIEEPKVAVCLLPGTEVAFEDQVERAPTGFLFRIFKRNSKAILHKVARFRPVNIEKPSNHHDALEFPDGQIVLLTYLAMSCHQGSNPKRDAGAGVAPRVGIEIRAAPHFLPLNA